MIKDKNEYYGNCDEVTLDLFCQILKTGKVELLLINGAMTNDELADAWAEIWDEYCQISGNSEYQIMLDLLKEVGILRAELMAIETAIIVLRKENSPEHIEILKQLGYDYNWDYSLPDLFFKNLEKVSKKVKNKVVLIQDKQKQIEAEQAKITKQRGGKFEDNIPIVSKYMGFAIRKKETSLAEFAGYIAAMKAEAKRQQNNRNNGRG